MFEDKDSKTKKRYCNYREEDFDFLNDLEDEEVDNDW